MPQTPPWSRSYRLSDLPGRKATRFDLAADEATLAAIAGTLGIVSVSALRFRGELRPNGRSDWELHADLSASVVQECVVTLAPVTTEISETVTRRYLSDMTEPEGDEVEIPPDESAEPLPGTLDIGEVMIEALALALPAYPRADGVDAGDAQFAGPGLSPMTDEDMRPFAGLADLLKKGDDKP